MTHVGPRRIFQRPMRVTLCLTNLEGDRGKKLSSFRRSKQKERNRAPLASIPISLSHTLGRTLDLPSCAAAAVSPQRRPRRTSIASPLLPSPRVIPSRRRLVSSTLPGAPSSPAAQRPQIVRRTQSFSTL
ncbi:hypothetical protein PIB30_029429 [Stylosanthes scabra]|uniref:Uncharacterized protein n=1 Tax=Stylosanthes scabra TaxID=79078 RepID=A0ABU6X8U7_9FABA|nr:hypothetical protein [Stylosanthes scabra]